MEIYNASPLNLEDVADAMDPPKPRDTGRWHVSNLLESANLITKGDTRYHEYEGAPLGIMSMGRIWEAAADAYLLVAAEEGLGKLTPLDMYPRQKRGGMGVKTFNIVTRGGEVTAAEVVSKADQLMIISAEGIVECTAVKNISVQGRSTQGVKLMALDSGDKVVAIAAFE